MNSSFIGISIQRCRIHYLRREETIRRPHTNDIGWAKHNERLRKEAQYKDNIYLKKNQRNNNKSSPMGYLFGIIVFTIIGGIAGGPAGAIFALVITIILSRLHSLLIPNT